MSLNAQLLILNAQILLPEGDLLVGEVHFHQGKIINIAPKIELEQVDKEIDAQGLILLPGVIDPQVHFREPGLKHKEDLLVQRQQIYQI